MNVPKKRSSMLKQRARSDSPRAIQAGITKLLLDDSRKRTVAVDIGKAIHQHPTLGESIGIAAGMGHGSCRDLPPARK